MQKPTVPPTTTKPSTTTASTTTTATIAPVGRIAAESSSIDIDAFLRDHGVPNEEIQKALQRGPTFSFIEKLWYAEENQDVVNKFMQNRFCQIVAHSDCVRETDPAFKLFQTYAIQDYFYLVDFVKFKALRLTTIQQQDTATLKQESESLGKTYAGYVEDWVNRVMRPLGLTEENVRGEERSIAELAYANFLQNNARMEDWFNLHVIMVACAYGWSKLSLKLVDDKCKTTGVFWDKWIKANLSWDGSEPGRGKASLSSSANKISTFLDANQAIWKAEIDKPKWGSLFRTALRLETALFDSAFSPYGDVGPVATPPVPAPAQVVQGLGHGGVPAPASVSASGSGSTTSTATGAK